MSYTELLPALEPSSEKKSGWKGYVSDSLLALGSIFCLTGMIFLFHLYARIPDSLLLYLLVILGLASIRGRYAASLAAFVAFFSFDFLFIPPVYSLIISKFGDFLALIVFLVTAIITGQLTSILRRQAKQARRREHETRILYDLVRATNREEDLERQLQIFVRAVVEVFSSWGVRDCILHLPDAEGRFTVTIGTPQPDEQARCSPEEEEKIAWVRVHARTVDISATTLSSDILTDKRSPTGAGSTKNKPCYVRLVPLKTDQKVLGVLRLFMENDARDGVVDKSLGSENGQSTPQAIFFRTFLEQAVALIERGRLQRESLRIKVLQQTDTLRAALVSSVSHDLRTPLSTIMTAATSLLQKDVYWDEEARESFALTIEQEARRLNRLVENLLDMSRIEGGALHPKKVWYPLDVVVCDVVSRMYPFLQGRPFQLHVPDDLPPVELDYIQLDQVMTNLLENAVRHTPAGSPLDVSIQAQGEWMQVSIADRGPGIPLAERELIFDKFYRVLGEASVTDQDRGSGLGLAVCRGLVESHGGRIWVEPREGGGSVFRFTLPQAKTEGKER